jgi:hypothetical protein
MRDRHFPRVCRPCRAPMASQEDTCWRCGTQWAGEEGPRTTLRVIAGGAGAQVAVADGARVAADARLHADRWMNEGGSSGSDVAARLRAAP